MNNMNPSLNNVFFYCFHFQRALCCLEKKKPMQSKAELSCFFFSLRFIGKHCQMHISIHVDPLRDLVSVYRRQPSPVRATVLGTESFSFCFHTYSLKLSITPTFITRWLWISLTYLLIQPTGNRSCLRKKKKNRPIRIHTRDEQIEYLLEMAWICDGGDPWPRCDRR